MRRSGSRSNQALRLLQLLEAEFPGVVGEYRSRLDPEQSAGPDLEEDVARSSGRVALRRVERKPSLFDYQEELAQKAVDCCLAEYPANVALLSLPTGAGKTRTAMTAVLRLLARREFTHVAWLAPTRELLGQAFETAQSLWWDDFEAPDVDLIRADVLGAFPIGIAEAVFFATPQMIAARALRPRKLPDFQVIVFDEAHHVPAPTFTRAVTKLRDVAGGAGVLGLSATPGRSIANETERLTDFFQGRLLWSERLQPNPIRVLQRRGVLSRLNFRRIPIANKVTIGGVRLRRFRALIDLVARLARREERALVFAETVDLGVAMVTVLRRMSVTAEMISAATPVTEREQVLKQFENGTIRVIVNRSVLAAGYDCPAVRHVVIGTLIRSAVLFEQVVGRASRGPSIGGNARSTVWELDDHRALHGLPASYYRYDDYDWTSLH